jgi:hypothetical protein
MLGSMATQPALDCLVCLSRPGERGALCSKCVAALGEQLIEPHQIRWRPSSSGEAALVDVFGRVHGLAPVSRVGRAETNALCIPLEQISREHAELRSKPGHGWECETFGSNGSFRNGVRFEGCLQLDHGDRLSFGRVPFYFVRGRIYDNVTRPDPLNPSARATAETRRVTLHQRPAGEGPGDVSIGGNRLTLSERQFDVLQVLLHAAREGSAYLPTELLRERIPWDEPIGDVSYAAVRKAVQSVRKRLESLAPGLIQSAQGHGYRLDTDAYQVS